jgi:glutamate dehydrogenase
MSKKSLDYKSFLKTFYETVPAEDVSMMAPENLSYTAKMHLEMAQDRRPHDPASIHIYTPTKENHGWNAGRTIIDIVNDDRSFLVDSVVAEIIHSNYNISVFIHPVLHVSRTKNGALENVGNKREDNTNAQSHIHIELSRQLSSKQIAQLEENLKLVLEDVALSNRDWLKMRDKVPAAKNALDTAPKKFKSALIKEYKELLDYLYHNNFTFLGYREYKFVEEGGKTISKIVRQSSLGLLSDERKPVYINEARLCLTQDQQDLRIHQNPLTISKVNKRSTVHRRVPLDAITIKKYDSKGKVSGEILFIGLFTAVTYSRSVRDVPYLRMKVDNVVEKTGFEPNSHNYKTIGHILEKYPRDEILQMPEKLLYEHAISILRLQEKPNIALYTRADPFGRYVSCLVYIPRERYETKLRLKFQKILEDNLGGQCTNFKVLQDDSPLSRVLYLIDINAQGRIPSLNNNKLEGKLIKAAQNWPDMLKEEIEDRLEDPQLASDMMDQYVSAFPVSYHEHYSPFQGLLDIQKIEKIIHGDDIELELYEEQKKGMKEIRLKLYHARTPLALSDVLPILENSGLNVITEFPSEIRPAAYHDTIWIHDFLLTSKDDLPAINISKSKESFEDVFKKIWNTQLENDHLNMLSLYAQMPWEDITILRAYIHYLRQTGIAFSLPYMESALTTYPDIAKELVSFFKDMFNPENGPLSEKKKSNRIEKIYKSLDVVTALDHDRIFRSLVGLIAATLRTNFYQTVNRRHKNYLSFKLDSDRIEELPLPKPYREIFVYSARVEGVHLRGDKIARGGLRWSDRHEDFRTEVLGLMKAQQVKNAVIVPMGAKGGFVVKNPPPRDNRAAFLEEGIECYKIFIRGLLDITDNRKGKDVIPPRNVIRYDEDDPYFVVAADKGTATFSDIANQLSEEYEFWLGDAFASGGSAGYDHKKMGITARGAWESVKRHFRELNHDIQTQDFDVIGVGDMGGDVFGNGLLLSKHIRLVGAFNHLHIFCDPDPDVAASFKERQRLFNDVKGWDHYNEELLSKGGKIYSRFDKSLTLTPEIRKRFNIEDNKVSPNRLIRAMLTAKTDLLWFGGIGTYIKASAETDIEVGDKGNDALRVDAREVQAKVIGEGANLAITQMGRIEYAQNGGRINADYIDNAGGVASSDYEVNIKILLNEVVRDSAHGLDTKKRNKLLESMTDDVAAHVLRGNYQQAQGISLMEFQAADKMGEHRELMRYLKEKVNLSRTLESLPLKDEIDRRIKIGKGLTRPELSVLQSYAKIAYTREFLDSDIPASKAMEERLFRYFPEKLVKKYQKEILEHRLRHEIVATTLANGIVNRMGPDFIRERMNRCGVTSAAVAKAYIITREAFELRQIWNSIEALDGKVPAIVQIRALHETTRMIERAVTWFLTRFGRKLDINRDIELFEEGIRIFKQSLDSVIPQQLESKIDLLIQNNVSNGLPRALAKDISLMPVLGSACDIVRISIDHKYEIPLVASIYFDIGNHFNLDWMRERARQLPTEGQHSDQALEALIDQLYTCQAGLTVRILNDMKGKITPPKGANAKPKVEDESVLEAWLSRRGDKARLLEPFFAELRDTGSIDFSLLIIAEQRLRGLYGG